MPVFLKGGRQMSGKGQITKIVMMIGVVGLLIMGLLWKEGIDPFSMEAVRVVGRQAEQVIVSSNRNLAEVSRKTTEQVNDATKSVTQSASKPDAKQEKAANKKMQRTDDSIGEWVQDKVAAISGFLPDWLPGRPYVVMGVVLAGLLGLIILVDKKIK